MIFVGFFAEFFAGFLWGVFILNPVKKFFYKNFKKRLEMKNFSCIINVIANAIEA